MSTPPIYLDYHATTPVDDAVFEAMKPFFSEAFANPASSHGAGRHGAEAVEIAREQTADLLGVKRGEVIFTSGATEANNLALLGAAKTAGERRRVITFAAEHPAVIEPLQSLASDGFDVVVLGVDAHGHPDLDELRRSVDRRTLLVSVAAANHEVGSVVDLAEVSRIAHEVGALLHSDASQAAGKIRLDARAAGVDLMSISAHKFYGPKGAGALYASAEVQTRLRPLAYGGGHERGLRSGTANVTGIVGLGAAACLAQELLVTEAVRSSALRDRLHEMLSGGLDGLELNGPEHPRLPGNLNVRIPGVEAQALIARCPQLAFSAGSACSSMTPAPSPVLLAIGRSAAEAEESIRLCVGRPTTDHDIGQAAEILIRTATEVRQVQATAITAA